MNETQTKKENSFKEEEDKNIGQFWAEQLKRLARLDSLRELETLLKKMLRNAERE